uniref:Uncharacterized protein n=1 Tax=Sphaerodactylus townsendi TaxID=933632 RepID=A0ACB8ECX9_9SAUR
MSCCPVSPVELLRLPGPFCLLVANQRLTWSDVCPLALRAERFCLPPPQEKKLFICSSAVHNSVSFFPATVFVLLQEKGAVWYISSQLESSMQLLLATLHINTGADITFVVPPTPQKKESRAPRYHLVPKACVFFFLFVVCVSCRSNRGVFPSATDVSNS